MKVNLKVWRQAGPNAQGKLVDYVADNVHPDMSFLEMLDVVNESLIKRGDDPIAFDSDCREGICGMCGLVIDGIPRLMVASSDGFTLFFSFRVTGPASIEGVILPRLEHLAAQSL